MIRQIIRNLDLFSHSISAGNGRITGIQWCVVHTLALRIGSGVEAIACEPIIPPARLALCTVGTIVTGLPTNIITVQRSSNKAVLCRLFLIVGGEVRWVQEFVDKVLILADAVAKHPTVVTVVVNAPLHRDNISWSISSHSGSTPGIRRLIVVYGRACIVTTGATTANEGGSEVGP